MQITLNQDEIEKALKNYVASQGISITGKHVDVTLIAGRAPNGMSASINISNDDMPNTVPTSRKLVQPEEPTVMEVCDTPPDPESVSESEIAARPLFGA